MSVEAQIIFALVLLGDLVDLILFTCDRESESQRWARDLLEDFQRWERGLGVEDG